MSAASSGSAVYIPINSLNRDDCEHLAKSYDQKGFVGKGASGQVFEVCKKGTKDCEYVLKILKYDNVIYEMTGGTPNTSRDYIKAAWEREVKIMQKLNDCQKRMSSIFVPIIYDAWFCTTEDHTLFYIVMERLEGNLAGFIKKFKGVEAVKAAALIALKLLTFQLRMIHKDCGICLVDIKLDNILFKQTGPYSYDFIFADLGSAMEADTACQEIDTARFIKSCEEFEAAL